MGQIRCLARFIEGIKRRNYAARLLNPVLVGGKSEDSRAVRVDQHRVDSGLVVDRGVVDRRAEEADVQVEVDVVGDAVNIVTFVNIGLGGNGQFIHLAHEKVVLVEMLLRNIDRLLPADTHAESEVEVQGADDRDHRGLLGVVAP